MGLCGPDPGRMDYCSQVTSSLSFKSISISWEGRGFIPGAGSHASSMNLSRLAVLSVFNLYHIFDSCFLFDDIACMYIVHHLFGICPVCMHRI